MPRLTEASRVSGPAVRQGADIAVGLMVGGYRSDRFKSAPAPERLRSAAVFSLGAGPAMAAEAERASHLARGLTLCRCRPRSATADPLCCSRLLLVGANVSRALTCSAIHVFLRPEHAGAMQELCRSGAPVCVPAICCTWTMSMHLGARGPCACTWLHVDHVHVPGCTTISARGVAFDKAWQTASQCGSARLPVSSRVQQPARPSWGTGSPPSPEAARLDGWWVPADMQPSGRGASQPVHAPVPGAGRSDYCGGGSRGDDGGGAGRRRLHCPGHGVLPCCGRRLSPRSALHSPHLQAWCPLPTHYPPLVMLPRPKSGRE